jgi:Flp pilus assembly protein TadG
MTPMHHRNRRAGGQAIVVFALALTVIVLLVGVAVDGGYALLQRRNSQNAADFAALAGARIIAVWIAGNDNDGNDTNVKAAITASNNVNGGSTITFGASGPAYVGSDGSVLGRVGQGNIPAATTGVRVTVNRSWTPYFLRFVGINTWTASATAIGRGGWAASGPQSAVLPVGIAEAFFNHREPCSGAVSGQTNDPCFPAHLTPGTLNVPGGFGWLKFGCHGYGLGQDDASGGCQTNKTFLQTEIGPPGNSFGCCTAIGQPGSSDLIGSLPGDKASADCSAMISAGSTMPVAVWDYAGGTGSNAYYHIVGFTGFQVTSCDGGKDIEGVWRQPFYVGPTTPIPGFAGAALAVQLIQ